MFIVKIDPSASGSRPPLQTWQLTQPPEGYAAISDADAQTFAAFRGFVAMEVVYAAPEGSLDAIPTAAQVTGNQAALGAYLAEYPDPVPEPDKPDEVTQLKAQVAALTTSNQMLEDCLVEMAQTVYA